jgi:hypothetical protein
MIKQKKLANNNPRLLKYSYIEIKMVLRLERKNPLTYQQSVALRMLMSQSKGFSTVPYLQGPGNTKENIVQNNNNEKIKYLRETYEPDHAGTEERELAKRLVNKFEHLKKNGSVTVDNVRHGSENLDKEIDDITKHNY